MKRLGFLLVAIVFCFALFAEDGEVLPEGVFRLTNVLSFNTYDKAFNDDSDKVDCDKIKLGSYSVGLEYGIIDWLSCGIQWGPAWNFYSDVEVNGAPDQKVKVAPIGGWFAGLKFQFVGEQGAFMQSENMRFAVTGGAFAPAPYSLKDQSKNAAKGKDFLVPCDSVAFMVGGRAHFDYIFPKFFDINFTTEFMRKLPVDSDKDQTAFENNMKAASGYFPHLKEVKEVDYGYHCKFELTPHFGLNVTDRVSFGVSTPVSYTINSDVEWDGKKAFDGKNSFLVNLSSGVGLNFLDATLPFEVNLDFNMNVFGKNVTNDKFFSLTFTPYFAF